MPTPNSHSEILNSLTEYIRTNHSGLSVSFGHGGVNMVGAEVPETDLVIRNPATGHILGIEIKAYPEYLPYGVYPQLKATHEGFRAVHGQFVAITPSRVTPSLLSNIAASGINVICYDSKTDLYPKLEPKLRELEASSYPIQFNISGNQPPAV